MYKIENENGECVKETTTGLKIKKQPKGTNGSATQLENPAALKQKCVHDQ